MTNLRAICNMEISGIYPFINADRQFILSVLKELSMCEECPWSLHRCETVHDCCRKIEEWLDKEVEE